MSPRETAREELLHAGDGAAAAFARCRALLWRYDFYPSSIVQGELRDPAVGVVIDQRIRAGPLRFRAPVRLTEVWDEPTRAGYQYEALPGHPERGWARFELARVDERVVFRIRAQYNFHHWLARLGRPFAERLRARAVDGAFARMKEAARG